MAVIKSLKQTPTEKRLQSLREQLYGKNPVPISYTKIVNTTNSTKTEFISSTKNYQSDINYLRTDLLKILVLASIAFAVQITLYIIMNHGFLKI
ncbi:MAG: hypothetical protein Q7R97_00570 [Candidatus Daviesbacteria bacterium]|nr:hypothetical protein [Candidatus Daviesbacteria bacterium]